LAWSELYVDLKNGKCMLYEMKTHMVPLKVSDSHTEDEGNLYYSNSEVLERHFFIYHCNLVMYLSLNSKYYLRSSAMITHTYLFHGAESFLRS
jgi:hypothetical protein